MIDEDGIRGVGGGGEDKPVFCEEEIVCVGAVGDV